MSSSPDETAPLFDISGLHYRYAGAQVDALADLELEVHAGEFVAVVGANGSGKSTLARLIGGLEKPAAARELRGDGLAIVYITQEMDETVGADRVVALERGTEAYAGDACGLFADTALVRRLGLGLPAAGELALALAEQGRDLPGLPLTMDELLDALGGAT